MRPKFSACKLGHILRWGWSHPFDGFELRYVDFQILDAMGMKWPSLYQHLPMITNSQWTIWNHQKQKGEVHRDLTQPHLKWWLRIGESSNIDPSWLHIRFTKILWNTIPIHRHSIQRYVNTLKKTKTTSILSKTPNLKHHEIWRYIYGSNQKKRTDWPRTQTFLGVGFFGFSGSTKDATWARFPAQWVMTSRSGDFREVGSENGMISFCCYTIMNSGGNEEWVLIATRNCMVSTVMRIHCDWSEGLRVCHLEWVVHSGV